MEARRATLESMGLRSEKAVAKHILEDNVWESNLVPDIAGQDSPKNYSGYPWEAPKTPHGLLRGPEMSLPADPKKLARTLARIASKKKQAHSLLAKKYSPKQS